MQSTKTKNKMADKQKKKLSEEEKNTLIWFYEINKPLWRSDSKFKDKEEKGVPRDEMIKPFDQTYLADFLEKTFHTLRTVFIREHKKIAAGQDPNKKKWKFYEKLELLKEEIDKPKKPQFNVDERELLIDFFKSHPSLWNHNTTDHRDRKLRDSLLEKLVDEFDNKFKNKDIKQEWHSLQVSYKREKAREEESKTSGSGCSEVYYSTWEHFNDTASVDESYTLLDSEPYVPPSKKRRRKKRKKGMQKCSYGNL